MSVREFVAALAIAALGLGSQAEAADDMPVPPRRGGDMPVPPRGPDDMPVPSTPPALKDFSKDYDKAQKAQKKSEKADDNFAKLKEYGTKPAQIAAAGKADAAKKAYHQALEEMEKKWGEWVPSTEPVAGDKPLSEALAEAGKSEEVKDAKGAANAADRAVTEAENAKKEAQGKAAKAASEGKKDEQEKALKQVEAADKKIEAAKEAASGARGKWLEKWWETVKKEIEKRRVPSPGQGNAKYKASANPKANEPAGGAKVSSTSYMPPAGANESVGLKTTTPTVEPTAASQTGAAMAVPVQPPTLILQRIETIPVSKGISPTESTTSKPVSTAKPAPKVVAKHPKGCTCKECNKEPKSHPKGCKCKECAGK